MTIDKNKSTYDNTKRHWTIYQTNNSKKLQESIKIYSYYKKIMKCNLFLSRRSYHGKNIL